METASEKRTVWLFAKLLWLIAKKQGKFEQAMLVVCMACLPLLVVGCATELYRSASSFFSNPNTEELAEITRKMDDLARKYDNGEISREEFRREAANFGVVRAWGDERVVIGPHYITIESR